MESSPIFYIIVVVLTKQLIVFSILLFSLNKRILFLVLVGSFMRTASIENIYLVINVHLSYRLILLFLIVLHIIQFVATEHFFFCFWIYVFWI